MQNRPLAAASAGLLSALVHIAASAETVTTTPVVVTATRTAESADETLAAVTVIGRDEIATSQAQDVAELLRLHAGIDIARNGGPGQTTSVFLRGTDSNHTLILIDGVRMNPGTIGNTALQNINPEQIEKIEIVRGPRSSLYGSDAIGGVIQIFTRRGKRPLDGELSISGGSNNTWQVNSALSTQQNGFRAGANVGFLDSEGFPTRTTSSEDAAHNNLTANLYAGYGNDAVDFELSHWRSEGNTEYLDFFLAPLDQDFENSVSAITLKGKWSAVWSPTIKLSYLEDEIRQQQSDDFLRTRRWILDWQNDLAIGEHNLLTAGIYLIREQDDSLSFGTAFDEDVDVNAAFIQDQIEFGRQRLLGAVRYTDHDAFNGHTTWNLAWGMDIGNATRVFASVGTGFRAPDATDRFGFGGTPDLDPEKSTNYEAGIEHHFDSGQSLRLTAFRNDIDDLINFFDPDGFLGPAVGSNVNIDEARITGIEAAYVIRRSHFLGRIEATLQNPENRDTGKELARRAKQTLTATAQYDFGRMRVGSELIATGKRRDSDFSNARLGGYGLWNLTLDIPLRGGLSVGARVENILDKDYFLADGFRTQERAGWLTLRYRANP